MSVTLIFGNSNDKLDDFIYDAHNKGALILDMRSHTKEKIQQMMQIANNQNFDKQLFMIMGNKKMTWLKYASRIFSGRDVQAKKVGDFKKNLESMSDIRIASLKTEVIAMTEWEDKIEESLKMIDVSLYSEASHRAKISKDI